MSLSSSSTIIKTQRAVDGTSDAASVASTKKATKCFFCHEEGHVAAVCSKLQAAKKARAERQCFYCQQRGHVVSDCAEKKKAVERKAAREAAKAERACFFCFEKGHVKGDCAEFKAFVERKARAAAKAKRCAQPGVPNLSDQVAWPSLG